MNKIKTSKVVSIAHLDRIADYITESIIDATNVGGEISDSFFECFIFNNQVILLGAENSVHPINYIDIVRQAIKDISYPKLRHLRYYETSFKSKIKEYSILYNGLDIKFDAISILNSVRSMGFGFHRGVEKQNRIDIVNNTKALAYACDDTPTLVSIEYFISKTLSDYLYNYRGVKFGNILPNNSVITNVKYNNDNEAESIESISIELYSDSSCISLSKIKNNLIRDFKSNYPQFNHLFNTDSNITIRLKTSNKNKSGASGRYVIDNSFYGNLNKSFIGTSLNSQERFYSFAAEYIAKAIIKEKLAKKISVEYFANLLDNTTQFVINTHNTNQTEMSDMKLSNLLKNNINYSEEILIEKFYALDNNYANRYKM